MEEKQELIVTPNYWSGYGVLGCHFYSLTDKEGAFIKVKDVLPGNFYFNNICVFYYKK